MRTFVSNNSGIWIMRGTRERDKKGRVKRRREEEKLRVHTVKCSEQDEVNSTVFLGTKVLLLMIT